MSDNEIKKFDYKQYQPVALDVVSGQIYHWCGCGKTQTKPLCDKRGDCEQSIKFQAILSETIYCCGCTHTNDPPWCDGSHAAYLLAALKENKDE